MIFSDVILELYYAILGRKIVMIIGKQTSFWSKTGFLLSLPVKKVNDNNFSSQNIVISSKNNVQDDMNKSIVCNTEKLLIEYWLIILHIIDFYLIGH